MKCSKLLFFALLAVFFISLAGESHATILILKGESAHFTNTLFASFLAQSEEKVIVHNFKGANEKLDYEAIKKTEPALILAIGETPVAEIARNFPKIFVITIGYFDIVSVKDIPNVITVATEVPPAQAIPIVKTAFSAKKRVGVLYNPKLTGYVMTELKTEIEKNGYELAAIKVDSVEDVYLALKAFKGNIDLFYFITDATVFQPRAFSAVTSFLTDNKIPYISPASSLLKDTGVISLSVDPVATGRAAYRMAEKILSQDKKKEDLATPPRIEITFSLSSAKKMGINSDKSIEFFQYAVNKGYKVALVE